jgi:hypothetical protein
MPQGGKWKSLKSIGDCRRGIAWVVRRVVAHRLDATEGRTAIAGLSKLADLYTEKLERQRGQPRKPAEDYRDKSDEELIAEQVRANAGPH